MTQLQDSATACHCNHVEELHHEGGCYGLVSKRKLFGGVGKCKCRAFEPKHPARWRAHAEAAYWAGSRAERPE